ncbi:hypothetical protein [Streptomyces sp. x-80]|uniref:hypothetical protein n=1 Tax=Streptomyces sp. x-80 TaxID=2789282 RepID=UPI00397F3046
MRSLLCAAGAAGVLVWAAVAPAAAAGEPDGFTNGDPRIAESSGLTAGRAHPGVYWTHPSGTHTSGTHTFRKVAPVGLTGGQLPASAATADDRKEGTGAVNDPSGKGSSEFRPSFGKGALVFVVATVLVVALRRLFRRR